MDLILLFKYKYEPISFTFKVDQVITQLDGLTIQSGESKTVKLKLLKNERI